MDNWLQGYSSALAGLHAENLHALDNYLDAGIEFKDPFNHSFSQAEFIAILEDMFTRLQAVSFDIHNQLQHGNQGMIHWTFCASSKVTGRIEFQGMSRIVANDQGKIVLHHDYWDGSVLMQKLPVLGLVIAKVRKKLCHSDL